MQEFSYLNLLWFQPFYPPEVYILSRSICNLYGVAKYVCNLFLIRCTACSSSPDGYSKLCSCQISAWMQKLWANIPINQTVNNKIIRGFNSSKLAKICQIWSPPSLGTCRYHEIKNLHSNCLCTHTWQASEHKLNDTRPINEWFVMCNSGDLSSDKNISMPDKAIETKQIDTQAHYGLDVLLV